MGQKKKLVAAGALSTALLFLGSLPLLAGPPNGFDNAVGVTRINTLTLGNQTSTRKPPPPRTPKTVPQLTDRIKRLGSSEPPKKAPNSINPKVVPPPLFNGTNALVVRNPGQATDAIISDGTTFAGGQGAANNSSSESRQTEAPNSNNNDPAPSTATNGTKNGSSSTDNDDGGSTARPGTQGSGAEAATGNGEDGATEDTRPDTGPPPPPPATFAVLERRPDYSFHQPTLLFKASDTYSQGQTGLGMGPGLLGDSVRYVPLGEF